MIPFSYNDLELLDFKVRLEVNPTYRMHSHKTECLLQHEFEMATGMGAEGADELDLEAKEVATRKFRGKGKGKAFKHFKQGQKKAGTSKQRRKKG